MKAALLIVAASLGGGCAGVAGADPAVVDLRPKFVVGREDRFSVDMNSSREAKFVDSPATRPENYHQVLRVKRRVVAADDKGATLELIYEAAQVSILAGAREVSYDSENINDSEAELTLGPSVKAAINKPITVQVDPYGRVVKVTGNQTGPGASPSYSLLGDEMFNRTLTPLYGLAKEPADAKVGEAWTEVRKSPTQTGTITTTREFKVGAVDAENAHLSVGGSLALEPSEKAAKAKTKLDSQSITGEVVWNLAAGSVRTCTYRQLMKLVAVTEGHQRFATTDYTLTFRWIELWPPAAPAKNE